MEMATAQQLAASTSGKSSETDALTRGEIKELTSHKMDWWQRTERSDLSTLRICLRRW